MQDVFEITLLLDFYGQLLTERQIEVLELHFNNDCSLGEIAKELKISRQGVHDNIKRGMATLSKLEEKLGLVQKFTQQKKKAEEVLQKLKEIDEQNLKEEDRSRLLIIERCVLEILDS